MPACGPAADRSIEIIRVLYIRYGLRESDFRPGMWGRHVGAVMKISEHCTFSVERHKKQPTQDVRPGLPKDYAPALLSSDEFKS